ncbi:MAG: tetratricopeptide repeat protein [Nitrospirales bacterium]
MSRPFVILLGILFIGILAYFWNEASQPTSSPTLEPPAEISEKPLPPLQYVGGKTCTTCHAHESQLWEKSHHDLAMQEANEATVLGNFNNATFTNFGVTSRFYQQGERFLVQTDGPDGTLADYEITYTFGVTPLQQYLIEFPGGRYQALGIAWDARPQEEGGQRWFHLYPNEKIAHDDELHWTGPNQNWNYMCAECHSTHLQKNYDLATNSYQTTWTDMDVACEACHGPGSRHVTWAENKQGEGQTGQANGNGLQVRFPPFNDKAWQLPAGGNTAKHTAQVAARTEIEACARCHARRTSITDVYEHGKLLLETHRPSLLEQGLYHADGQILDEVYVYGSFLQSKMYHAGVTCNDCHEPHGLKLRETGNVLCTRCHRSEHFDSQTHHFHKTGTAGTQCVECHMPSQTYMVVDPRRDHSIRVPRPDLSAKLDTPNACNQCHKNKTATWAADHVGEWYGPRKQEQPHYGEVLKAGREREPGGDVALLQLANEKTNSGIVRASALALLQRYPSAKMVDALKAGMQDKEPLVRIGAVRALDAIDPKQRYELGAALLNDPVRAVRIEAGRYLASIPSDSLSKNQQDQLNQTVDEYIQSQLVNAERPSSHMNLGILYAERGQLQKAEEEYQAALRLDSAFYPALVNLADLYRVQDQDAQGEGFLRQALEIAPNDASVHHALGLLLVRIGKKQEAMSSLKKATALQPDNSQYGYVYAIALHSTGESKKAAAMLEKIHLRHPNERQILMTLITIHRDLGNTNTALQFAKKLEALSQPSPAHRQ